MSKNVAVGAHSCVIDPKLEDAQLQAGIKYGRMFPGLSPREVDESAMAGLGREAPRMDATPPVVEEGPENRRIRPGLPYSGSSSPILLSLATEPSP